MKNEKTRKHLQYVLKKKEMKNEEAFTIYTKKWKMKKRGSIYNMYQKKKWKMKKRGSIYNIYQKMKNEKTRKHLQYVLKNEKWKNEEAFTIYTKKWKMKKRGSIYNIYQKMKNEKTRKHLQYVLKKKEMKNEKWKNEEAFTIYTKKWKMKKRGSIYNMY